MSAPRLDDRVAIITGGAGGIGRALVAALREAGASVAALDIDAPGLDELRESAPGAPDAPPLLTRVCDIADPDACEAAVEAVVSSLGGVHILVNNAALGMGVIRADHMTRLVGIEEIEPRVWQRFAAVDFSGAWLMTRAVIGHLRAQRWGRIINVTTSFFTMLRGGFHPYGPCKAGLEAMSAGHAQEFAGSGVTVNVVVPGGPADTAMVPAEAGFDRATLIRPAVMAPPIVWLCSDEGGARTGCRFVAAHWDASLPPAEAEAAARAPIAWPELAQSPVWPGGKPDR